MPKSTSSMQMGFAALLPGCVPLAAWAGRPLAGAGVRRFGGGNPGAANACRAGELRPR